MVRGKILQAISRVENFLLEKPSQAWKLAKGVGEAGTRATPPRNQVDDRKLGVRLDWGEELKKDGKTLRRIKLQLNSNATDKTLREAAQKNSHRVWAIADIEVNPNITKEEAPAVNVGMFQQLRDNLDE